MLITYVPNPNAADGRGVTTNGNVFPFDGNPNGNVTCTGAGVVVGSGSSQGLVWAKTTTGTSNTDWFPVIA